MKRKAQKVKTSRGEAHLQNRRGIVAKLLAAENLSIVHSQSEVSAKFNTDTRVLTLPVWDVNESVYDLLVGHEVAHALYTPKIEEGQYDNISFDAINVVEDARIEKLMKRKYPGLVGKFREGYRSLISEGFFPDPEDIPQMNFLDKINIRFKCGSYDPKYAVTFTAQEQKIVDMIEKAETFKEVIDICKLINSPVTQQPQSSGGKQKGNQKIKIAGSSQQAQGSSSAEGDSSGNTIEVEIESDFEDSEGSEEDFDNEQSGENSGEGESESEGDSESDKDDSESNDGKGGSSADSGDSTQDSSGSSSTQGKSDSTDQQASEGGGSSGSGKNCNVLSSSTQKNFNDKLKSKAQTSSNKIIYAEFDHNNLHAENLIVPIKTVSDKISGIQTSLKSAGRNIYENSISQLNSFLSQDKALVSHMIREFEQKKSAEEYKKIQIVKSGVLDTTKMHSYKYSDDIFLRNTVTPTGKNHGMVLFLDMSGSMDHIILSTFCHIIRIMTFCKRMSIPFQVYGFSDNAHSINMLKGVSSYTTNNLLKNTPTSDYYFTPDAFALIELFNSDMKLSDYKKHMEVLWAVFHYYEIGGRSGAALGNRYSYPQCFGFLGLSGTPLDSAIMCSPHVFKNFMNNYRVDKFTFIYLTDGESSPANINERVPSNRNNRYYGGNSGFNPYNTTAAIVNTKEGIIIPPCSSRSHFHTYDLISYVKKICGCNVAGFRLVTSSSVPSTCYPNRPDRLSSDNNQLQKNKFVRLDNTPYDDLYIIKSEPQDFSDPDTFSKMLKRKSSDKMLLSTFMDLVS